MREPREDEKPYADYVEEIEGLGSVFVRELCILTRTFFIGAFPFDVPNPMALREVKKVFQEQAAGKTILCLCPVGDERRHRFVCFFGFKEVDRDKDYVRYLRPAEGY